ncbi:MAG TPA: sulfatase-like hydrolase/transferase, partial [Fibrobacteria bacterium]|nr:sulfatase-like hydrolase/transferase [Fibrobacteria bacterium]
DIAGWGAGGPVLAAFLPQVGHGPWEDVAGAGVTDMLRRGRNVAVLQDRMLGRVLEALRRAGQAERTVVVVTSDHGLRTRAEYPALPGGAADSISFHVPLLVRAPAAAGMAERIPWVTSHIDVAPTLLDLLGVEAGRETEQGLPVWDRRLAGRTTFLLGRHYLGADAYHEDGTYAMWSHLSATGYGPRRSLHFPPAEARPEGPSRAEAIHARITRMTALQDALLRADAERLARDVRLRRVAASPPRGDLR